MLAGHRDSAGRPAVLTADMVLTVPNTTAIRASGYREYTRRTLDEGFPHILEAVRKGMRAGTLVPQLHGIEHFYGRGLLRLATEQDPRVNAAFSGEDWWDWEALDSPLQGHYVDGTQLPTSPLSKAERREAIASALAVFERLFGFRSTSTVAPCYLWDDGVERIWAAHGVRYVQTAGYRCTGRDENGRYIQDPSLLRPGDRSTAGQIYLVRNAMYEPVDGRGEESCFREAVRAHQQALPIVISTHRYNFTRSAQEHRDSLNGLDRLLQRLQCLGPAVRYLSSPELGAWIAGQLEPLTDPVSGHVWPTLARLRGLPKVRSFLYRLWYRHTKLRLLAVATGLVVPVFVLILLGRRTAGRST